MEYRYTPPLLRIISLENITQKKRYELFTQHTQKQNKFNKTSTTHPDRSQCG